METNKVESVWTVSHWGSRQVPLDLEPPPPRFFPRLLAGREGENFLQVDNTSSRGFVLGGGRNQTFYKPNLPNYWVVLGFSGCRFYSQTHHSRKTRPTWKYTSPSGFALGLGVTNSNLPKHWGCWVVQRSVLTPFTKNTLHNTRKTNTAQSEVVIQTLPSQIPSFQFHIASISSTTRPTGLRQVPI